MRVAVLCDIHGNLPALDAVLAEVERAAPDAIALGGDIAEGPMAAETLDRLAALALPMRCVRGNAERDLVEAFDAGARPEDAEEPFQQLIAWAAQQLDRGQRDALAAYEPTVTLAIDGVGPTLFCHGSPRSDTEMITTLTPAERLAPMLEGVDEAV